MQQARNLTSLSVADPGVVDIPSDEGEFDGIPARLLQELVPTHRHRHQLRLQPHHHSVHKEGEMEESEGTWKSVVSMETTRRVSTVLSASM